MSHADRARRAIAAAPLRLEPFPHFVADGVLSLSLLRLIRLYWPRRCDFAPEGGGELFRSWVYLTASDVDVTDTISGRWRRCFWGWFVQQVAPVLIRAIFERFAPFRAPFGLGSPAYSVGQLVCFEASARFTEHGPHTHYSHGPFWLYTALLQVDDDAGAERGTRLFSVEGLDPESDELYWQVLQNSWGSESVPGSPIAVKPAVDSGFAPGRLLAFADTPVSVHGSTPAPSGGPRGRKVLRLHVLMTPADAARLYGVGLPESWQLADVPTLPGFALDRAMIRRGFGAALRAAK
jgi:hypothetical protein